VACHGVRPIRGCAMNRLKQKAVKKPGQADANCDTCGELIDLTRAQARIIRSFFGSLQCPQCNEDFCYADAWDELTTGVSLAVEGEYGGQTE
jgi:ssDNA-binding Zn-finger/Zn-ribbon topoisomerase 1